MLVADYKWIQCQGCDGELGIPAEYAEAAVTCPECKAKMQVSRGILLPARQRRIAPRTPVEGSTFSVEEPPKQCDGVLAFLWGESTRSAEEPSETVPSLLGKDYVSLGQRSDT